MPILDPFAAAGPARARGAFAASGDGEGLCFAVRAPLPLVCLKCGREEGVLRRPTRFHRTPGWARAIGGLVAVAAAHGTTLAVPLCRSCALRQRFGWMTVTGAVLVAVALSYVFSELALGSRAFALALAIGIVATVVAVILAYRWQLLTLALDDETITLGGVHAGAVRAILDAAAGTEVDAAPPPAA